MDKVWAPRVELTEAAYVESERVSEMLRGTSWKSAEFWTVPLTTATNAIISSLHIQKNNSNKLRLTTEGNSASDAAL
jgi:hypothetical protein